MTHTRGQGVRAPAVTSPSLASSYSTSQARQKTDAGSHLLFWAHILSRDRLLYPVMSNHLEMHCTDRFRIRPGPDPRTDRGLSSMEPGLTQLSSSTHPPRYPHPGSMNECVRARVPYHPTVRVTLW